MKYSKLASIVGGIVLGIVGAFSVQTSVFAAAPVCNGKTATVYVENGRIVGGPDNGKFLILTSGVINGGNGDDVIVGTSVANTINGENGNDTICGEGGADNLNGGNDNDWISGGSGADIINGDNDSDIIYGDDGADVISGNNGTDSINGGAGNDFINGGNANDLCTNGGGTDLKISCEGEWTLVVDTDGDGIEDGTDNCPAVANANQTNTDGDAQGDACDTDDDNDTVLDGSDNCPLVSNTDQMDTGGDGQGDACDTDNDNDTVPNDTDNCSLIANEDQANADNDTEGDACDTDDDNDTVPDDSDNCPLVSNVDQTNSDEQGAGDACTDDNDGDGVLDPTEEDKGDNCPLIANPEQEDADGDGLGDICDSTPEGTATLIVRVEVVNDDAGLSTSSDFNIYVRGTNPSPAAFLGSTTGTVVNIEPGEYMAGGDEVLVGYTQSVGEDCDFATDIVRDEERNCTIIFDDIHTNGGGGEEDLMGVQVVVLVENDNLGTKNPEDFTVFVSGTSPSLTSFAGSASGTPVTLGAGAYMIVGSVDEGYTKSGDCEGIAVGGATSTCTIIYSDIGSSTGGGGDEITTTTVFVEVNVINDNGSTRLPEDFLVTVVSEGLATTTFPGSTTGTFVVVNEDDFDIDGSMYNDYTKQRNSHCNSYDYSLNPGTIGKVDMGIRCVITYDDINLIISNEKVAVVETTSVTITWDTNHPATSRVVYDIVSPTVSTTLPNYGYTFSTIENSEFVSQHSVTITGLTPNTTYFFRPVSHGSPEVTGIELTVTTLAQSSGGGSGGGGGGGSSGGGAGAITSVTPGTESGSSSTTTPPQAVLGERITEEDEVTTGEVLGFTTLPTTGGVDFSKLWLIASAILSIGLGSLMLKIVAKKS